MLLFRMMLVAAAAWFCAGATPAHAQWLKAESERFIVYSDGGERPLREFTQKLEVFDRLLRIRMGLSPDETPHRKLPIYLVRSRNGLARVNPALPEGVAGFYTANNEDIFAVAVQDRRHGMGEQILLHEYAHHFMMQNFPYPYPGWFVEGFAEYYMTAEIDGNRIRLGNYNDNRASWVVGSPWMSLSDLISSRPRSRGVRNAHMFYPQAWLLAHWFLADPERQNMLQAYLLAVGQGVDSVQAIERATGMSLAELQRTLRAYRRLPTLSMTHTFPPVEVTVTRLPRSADDLLLLKQRLTIGTPNEVRAEVAAEVRRAAARHGDDPLALLVLGHGELHFGERDQGRAALERLLEIDPDNVEALQFLAGEHLRRSREADEDQDVQLATARDLLARAYQVDDANYVTMLLLTQLRRGGSGWPNENDIATMEIAYTLAPQLAETRVNLASAMISTNRTEEAIVLLGSLANNPHGGPAAAAARSMINRARGGSPEDADMDEDADEVAETQDQPEDSPEA